MEIIDCPLCRVKLYTTAYESKSLQFVLCSDCGLVYQNPRMSASELSVFYAELYQATRHGVTDVETAVRRAREPGRFEKKKRRAEEIGGLLSSSSRVLEIGAGYGMLLAAIRDVTGAQVEGIEPSVFGPLVARQAYDLVIETCDVDAFLQKTHQPYDLIVMSHVLEHLLTPRETLSALRALLAPGGTLYLAVPNVLMPDDAPDRFFHFEHLTYFSPRTLVRVMNEAGFAVTLLEERPKELVVRAVVADIHSVSPHEWQAYLGSKEDVGFALSTHRRKYGFLSCGRKIVEWILPHSFSGFLRKKTASILRGIGFVKQ